MSKSRALDGFPVDDMGQFHQRVFGVEHLAQGLPKQISGLRRWLLRTHRNPVHICKKLVLLSQKLADIDSTNRPETRMNAGFMSLFSTDLVRVYVFWEIARN